MPVMPTEAEPVKLEQLSGKELGITWKDGHHSVYPCRTLRENCQCAGCIDEITRVKKTQPHPIPEEIYPIRITPVGRYALHFLWSDGHDSGIYPFDLLRSLCPCCQRTQDKQD